MHDGQDCPSYGLRNFAPTVDKPPRHRAAALVARFLQTADIRSRIQKRGVKTLLVRRHISRTSWLCNLKSFDERRQDTTDKGCPGYKIFLIPVSHPYFVPWIERLVDHFPVLFCEFPRKL